MRKLKKILFYAGMEPEAFQSIRPSLQERTRKNLRVFTGLASGAMLLMYLLSLFAPILVPNRSTYGISAVMLLSLCCLSQLCSKIPELIYPGVYAFLGLLFGFGIALGTLVEPDEMTVSFVILMFVAPLLFTDVPLRMCTAILAGSLTYLFYAFHTQDSYYFFRNLTDICMYGALSMVVSTYMMHIKVGSIFLEQENRFLSERDGLTGLMNRRSFEEALDTLRSGKSIPLLVCAFDVNGLKAVNDCRGHAAGDELLQGAAECIRRIFGKYGVCYRVGGDEFIAVLQNAFPAPEELSAAFREETARWHGNLVQELSVSLGLIPGSSGPGLDELFTRADKEMYADKKRYYHRS